MKKIILISTLILSSGLIFGQTAEKKWGIGLHFGTIQYKGDYGSEFFKFKDAHGAGMLSVSRYINPTWDVEGNISGGLLDYNWLNSNNTNGSFEGNLANVELLFKYKLIKRESRLAPYLFLGIGDGFYKNETFFPQGTNITFNFPMGGGLKVNMSPRLALDLRVAYHYTLTEFYDGIYPKTSQWNDQFLIPSIGIVFNVGKKDTDKDGISDRLDKCEATPLKVVVDAKGCPVDKDMDGIPDYLDTCPQVKGVSSAKGCTDMDGDGIADAEDTCPSIAGLANLKGCPDSDNDGIADADDKCPKIAGLASMGGCPDSDGDGITDAEDLCPNEKGIATMKGCPDKDGDGVSDKNDKCPIVKGTIANNGCPEVSAEVTNVLEQALKGVQFESGKDVIKKTSYGILDNVVKVMQQNPDYKLGIYGHTDSQGDDAKNLTLSQNRANAVKKYIADKNVDSSRMKAEGFGETKPVDTNETASGRAKNRRVEFKIEF